MTTAEHLPGTADRPRPRHADTDVVAMLIVEKMRVGRRPVAMTLPIAIRYTDAEPWAVALDFGPSRPRWELARCLLDAGRFEQRGDGDVVVRPVLSQWVEIELRPPGTTSVVLSIARADIDAALAFTEELVPPGAEAQCYDLTAELARQFPTVGGGR